MRGYITKLHIDLVIAVITLLMSFSAVGQTAPSKLHKALTNSGQTIDHRFKTPLPRHFGLRPLNVAKTSTVFTRAAKKAAKSNYIPVPTRSGTMILGGLTIASGWMQLLK